MTGFQIQLDWLMVVLMIIIMIMMNHFCETVDWKKVTWCLVSRWARKLALSKTSYIPTAGFELAQNLSSSSNECSCANAPIHQYIKFVTVGMTHPTSMNVSLTNDFGVDTLKCVTHSPSNRPKGTSKKVFSGILADTKNFRSTLLHEEETCSLRVKFLSVLIPSNSIIDETSLQK